MSFDFVFTSFVSVTAISQKVFPFHDNEQRTTVYALREKLKNTTKYG